MANLGGDFFGELGGIAAKVASNQPITAAFVRKAAITVSQGQDDQGFHMLVTMNGREYVLRGDEAENFRKEYAAIPKPQAQVNSLVEKYMNALKPYAAKAKEEPLWPEYVGRVERAENEHARQDEENYWAGKGAPGYRYSSLDMVADIVQHDKENRGQFRDFEPLTGSSDGEFSDIGGVQPLKVTASLQEGDAVQARIGASYFKGTVESVEGDKVTILSENGRIRKTVPVSSVQSLAQVHQEEQHRIQRDEADAAERQRVEQEEADKFRQEMVKNLTQSDATGTYDQLATYLGSAGYDLRCDPSDEQLEDFEQKYQQYTGEQLNAKSRPKDPKHAQKGGWILKFDDTPAVRKLMPWPIDVARTGLAPLSGEGKERAVTDGKKITVSYLRPIWELIKRGLRYEPKGEAQELRASMTDTKKACGDNCAEVDEEVTLPSSIEVEGQGGKSLPPAETAVETDKEAGFNFFFPGQVVKEFYPELQHEIVDYPNDNNAPMIEDIDLDSALETPKLSYVRKTGYVSTSPAAGAGIGRDGKEQVLEGAPLRNEGDIRGGMFMDEFHQQYSGVPGALLALAAWKPKTAGDEKAMFGKFLKYVCAEIAATMVAMFKTTSRPILNGAPGVGEVQLAQVEQPNSLSSFNIVNTGSRVKYLLEKINDGDIKEAINGARAQAAVWVDDPNGGFVYEVFVRAESIDTDSMIMKYTFVTGTKESE